MIDSRKIKIFVNIIGLIATVATVAFLIFVFRYSYSLDHKTDTVTEYNPGSITFDSDEIVFDGKNHLDLLSGVHIDDGNGNDITDTANVVITADGTLNRKIVRYTCFDAQGHTLTATRTLVMEDYDGPSLNVTQPLTIDASVLDNLIPYLQANNHLTALDGFGVNITPLVTCQRELISEGLYKMTFRVVNNYHDEKTISVIVRINGKVDDPTIVLFSDTVSVPMDRSFDPMNFIVSQSSCVGKIDVDSSVNVSKPGNYRVIYTAYTKDMTAKSTKIMQVTVNGNTNG